MNLERLRAAEASFLERYPQGFEDPAIRDIRRKHNVPRLIEFAREQLTRTGCHRPEHVAQTLLAIVSRSSMVSRFEKPRFKEFLGSLSSDDRKDLAYAVEQRLFGRRKLGFEMLAGMMAHHRIARWPVVSAVPFYFAPRREVFVKPTTTKRILAFLDVAHLHYQSTPSWEFYRGYRDLLTQVRKHVSPSLAPNNAALTGFLMMSM